MGRDPVTAGRDHLDAAELGSGEEGARVETESRAGGEVEDHERGPFVGEATGRLKRNWESLCRYVRIMTIN